MNKNKIKTISWDGVIILTVGSLLIIGGFAMISGYESKLNTTTSRELTYIRIYRDIGLLISAIGLLLLFFGGIFIAFGYVGDN